MLAKPRILLHAEGFAGFVICVYLYYCLGAGWSLFLLLFLWPDLGMLGYLASVSLGSRTYNLLHFALLPLALAGVSFTLHRNGVLSFALVWLAHIEFDRALGYGLKYPTSFKDTHLQRVG
jgi:hypothetical protein